MGCILGLIALFFPRLILFLIWLLGGNWLPAVWANSSCLWPVLGFIFVPLTTLAYAFAWHQTGGSIGGGWIALIVIAVLVDLGLFGGGARSARRSDRN